MKYFIFFFSIVFAKGLLFSQSSHAQVDMVSKSLLAPKVDPKESFQGSSRFESRQADPREQKPVIQRSKANSSDSLRGSVFGVGRKAASTEETATEGSQPEPSNAITIINAIPEKNPETKSESSVTVDSKSESEIHPNDLRHNRIQIELQFGNLNQDSKSNSAYRSFATSTSVYAVGMSIWPRENFGVSAQHSSSVGAGVNNVSGGRRSTFLHQLNEVEILYRRFVSQTRLSPSIAIGGSYLELSNKFSELETERISTKTSGGGLKLTAKIPSSLVHSWTFGGAFYPKLSHSEESQVANLSSGQSPQSNLFSAWFGSELKMDRENVLFWSLSTSVERNLFTESASSVDPITGVTPTGVGIEQIRSIFQIGLRWGR